MNQIEEPPLLPQPIQEQTTTAVVNDITSRAQARLPAPDQMIQKLGDYIAEKLAKHIPPMPSRKKHGFPPIQELLGKELLAIKEAAYILGTSDDGIRAKIRRNEIESQKIHGQRRVVTASIMQYIKPTVTALQTEKTKPEIKRMTLMERARAINEMQRNAGV